MINLIAYFSFLVVLVLTFAVIMLSKTIHYRLLKKKKSIFVFKWLAWFTELIYFPLMLNIVEYSTCNYYTQKEAVILINCKRDIPFGWYTVMWVSTLVALVVGLLYNIMLGVHLYREKISNMLNEEYIRKKEVEYVVGISEMWLTRYFFLFSSFKSDIFKMYHRVIFNTFQLLLVVVHAAMAGESPTKMGIILGLFTLYLAYVIGTRPYRCQFSNILMFIITSSLVVTCFVLMLKVSGLKSALFVDNYFYGLLILINGFGWFLVLAFLLLIVALKRRWPLDKDGAQKAI